MKNYIFAFTACAILFSGCSSKKYYEPKDEVYNYKKKIFELSNKIIDINAIGATLKDYKYISKNGESKLYLNDEYKFLNDANGIIVATNDDGTLYIKDNENIDFIDFKQKIVAATKKDNLIALIFANNTLELYNTDTKQVIYKEYLEESVLNDTRVSSPLFLETVVLYPTLNGKVLVVDIAKQKAIKTINIDPKGQINNIIYLNSVNDTLIAATTKKLFTFKDGNINIQDYDITNVTIFKKKIFITTLDGKIIKFNFNLKKEKEKKFKFAKFVTLAHGEKFIYALESQGFLLSFNKNLEKLLIFELSYDQDEKVLSIEDKIYFEDSYIKLD
jgi:hypothetical protein